MTVSRLVELVYLMRPAYLANMAPPFVKYWRDWNRPISRTRLGDHKTVIGFALAALAMSLSLGASAQSRKQSGPADPSLPVPPTKYEFVFSGNSRLRTPAKWISFSDDGR